MAKLYFKYGAMNSGKTTLICQAAHNYEENGMSVALFKPSVDMKGDNKIVSRVGISRKVDELIGETDNVFTIVKEKYSHVACVLVDEANFLTPAHVDQFMDVVDELGITVMCYGLRTDFKTNGFPGSDRLLRIAHVLEEIKTMCGCGRKATYNARYVDGKLVTEGEQIAIDGFDGVTYWSTCSRCFGLERKGEESPRQLALKMSANNKE